MAELAIDLPTMQRLGTSWLVELTLYFDYGAVRETVQKTVVVVADSISEIEEIVGAWKEPQQLVTGVVSIKRLADDTLIPAMNRRPFLSVQHG